MLHREIRKRMMEDEETAQRKCAYLVFFDRGLIARFRYKPRARVWKLSDENQLISVVMEIQLRYGDFEWMRTFVIKSHVCESKGWNLAGSSRNCVSDTSWVTLTDDALEVSQQMNILINHTDLATRKSKIISFIRLNKIDCRFACYTDSRVQLGSWVDVYLYLSFWIFSVYWSRVCPKFPACFPLVAYRRELGKGVRSIDRLPCSKIQLLVRVYKISVS